MPASLEAAEARVGGRHGCGPGTADSTGSGGWAAPSGAQGPQVFALSVCSCHRWGRGPGRWNGLEACRGGAYAVPKDQRVYGDPATFCLCHSIVMPELL